MRFSFLLLTKKFVEVGHTMKNKSFGLLALLVIGLIATTASVAAINTGGFKQSKEERVAAIEAGDFESWKKSIEATLTEEHFELVVEHYEHRQAMQEVRSLTRDAIMNDDYEAYVEAFALLDEEGQVREMLSEEEFSELVLIQENRDFNERPFRKGFFKHKFNLEE